MSENIIVKVVIKSSGETIELFHDMKRTLLQTMQENMPSMLPAVCGGRGSCGRCLVRFHKNAPLPVQIDRSFLTPDMLRQGYRLACKARPMQDCTVETAFIELQEIQNAEVVTSNSLEKQIYRGMGNSETEASRIEAVKTEAVKTEAVETATAVDIGTTTIAMQLFEVSTGEILDTYTCMNPQMSYGNDVIARIQAGCDGNGQRLQKLVRAAVDTGIKQFVKFIDGKKLCRLREIIISCNTTMSHLFMGYPVETLGRSPFTPVNIDTIMFKWNGCRTFIVPGVSAFVGGDILSGLFACDLYECRDTWLFLDLGTNAEMVMGNGKRIVCTAAAAGPAFEGRGKSAALGSDRIHAVAKLLEQGKIDDTGLMPAEQEAIQKVQICQKDIRDIQMAKAAIRTGIHFLMQYLGIEDYGNIERVYIAGGFGFYLDKSDAVRIGLLPAGLQDKTVTAGNTSLAGAVSLGKYAALKGEEAVPEIFKSLERYADRIENYNLAEEKEFDRIYMENINFSN